MGKSGSVRSRSNQCSSAVKRPGKNQRPGPSGNKVEHNGIQIELLDRNDYAVMLSGSRTNYDLISRAPEWGVPGEIINEIKSYPFKHPSGEKVDHNGIKIELPDQNDYTVMHSGSRTTYNLLSHAPEWVVPGEINEIKMYPFEFFSDHMKHDTYNGVKMNLRYILKVTIGRGLGGSIVLYREILVRICQPFSSINNPIKARFYSRSMTSILAMIDEEALILAVESLETFADPKRIDNFASDGRKKFVKVRPSVYMAGTGVPQVLDLVSDQIKKRFEEDNSKDSMDMESFSHDIGSFMEHVCKHKGIDLKKKQNEFDFAVIGTTRRSSGIFLYSTVDGKIVLDNIPFKSGPGRKCFVAGSGGQELKRFLEENQNLAIEDQETRRDFAKDCIAAAVKKDRRNSGGRFIYVVQLRRRDSSSSRKPGKGSASSSKKGKGAALKITEDLQYTFKEKKEADQAGYFLDYTNKLVVKI